MPFVLNMYVNCQMNIINGNVFCIYAVFYVNISSFNMHSLCKVCNDYGYCLQYYSHTKLNDHIGKQSTLLPKINSSFV